MVMDEDAWYVVKRPVTGFGGVITNLHLFRPLVDNSNTSNMAIFDENQPCAVKIADVRKGLLRFIGMSIS
jgi:hypothetical protein